MGYIKTPRHNRLGTGKLRDIVFLKARLHQQQADEGILRKRLARHVGYKSSVTSGVISKMAFLGERLIIPRVDNLQEFFFRLAYDILSQFGNHKSYHALKEAYYWLNMEHDLEESYILGCEECQQNEASAGPPA